MNQSQSNRIKVNQTESNLFDSPVRRNSPPILPGQTGQPLPASLTAPHVAVLFYRIGPYHFARLKAAARHLKITAVEFSNVDAVYAWDLVEGQDGFERRILFSGVSVASQTVKQITTAMERTLDELNPAAVAIPGWADPCSLIALQWCLRHKVPAIIMSETTAWDEARKPLREWVKKQVVSLCASGLVGGRCHAEYLIHLGMAQERIFLGYDAVDNDYFSSKTEEARKQKIENRKQFGLPEKYFLASARFVGKKNLPLLIRAYARYRELAVKAESRNQKTELWDLVLLGDGPLRPALTRLISELHLDACVHLPGFKQYSELPVYYAHASVFVHASVTEQWGLVVNEAISSGLPVLVSHRCGCAQELVQDGQNGFTFDPFAEDELAKLMCKTSAPDFDLESMCATSLTLSKIWGTAAFGEGLHHATLRALHSRCARPIRLKHLYLAIMVRVLKAVSRSESNVAPVESPKKKSESKSPVYHLYTFRGNKVMAVPHRYSRQLLVRALSRYQPFTAKRRWYVRALRGAHMIRSERIFAQSRRFLPGNALGFNYDRWVETLQTQRRVVKGHCVLAWPSDPTRHRFYVHLFDENLHPVAFVKASSHAAEQAKLQAEADALIDLDHRPLNKIRTPRPFEFNKFENVSYLVMEPLPLSAKPLHLQKDSDLQTLLKEISLPCSRLSGNEILRLSWWSDYISQLSPSSKVFHDALMHLLPLGASVGRAHGDMGLANMASVEGAIWLFDWERTSKVAPILTDQVGYFMSFFVSKLRHQPQDCLHEFQKRFFPVVSHQARLDLMLSIAFRAASGIPESAFYIRNWQKLAAE